MRALSKKSFEYKRCTEQLFRLKHCIDQAIEKAEIASTLDKDYKKTIIINWSKNELAKIVIPIDLF